jgi:DNA-3-methyladenine glycosylase II
MSARDNARPLTTRRLRAAVERVCGVDPALGAVVAAHGHPPLWNRLPGFPTLVHIILEQQVSLASAQAAFERLLARLGQATPEGLLSLDDAELLAIGFSRQKTRYARGLAEAVLDGSLDLDGLSLLADREVHAGLTALPGIGRWTADIYLVMALLRPDVWPRGDLALEIAAQEVLGLPERPDAASLEVIAEAWRPDRATAARILWHHYLSTPRPR